MTTKHYALLATRAAVRSGLTEQQLEHVASGHSRLGLRALIARYEVETYRVPLWRRWWVWWRDRRRGEAAGREL